MPLKVTYGDYLEMRIIVVCIIYFNVSFILWCVQQNIKQIISNTVYCIFIVLQATPQKNYKQII